MVEIYVYGRETYPLENIIKQIDYFSVMYSKADNSKLYHGFKCSKLLKGWYIEDGKGEGGLSDAEIIARLKKFCDKVVETNKPYPPLIIFNAPKGFDKTVLMMYKLQGTKTAVWGKKSHRNDLASELSKNFRKML